MEKKSFWYSGLGLACAACMVTPPPAEADPFEFTNEHVDIGLAEGDELELHWHDEDTDTEYEPDEAVAFVNTAYTKTFNGTLYYNLPKSQPFSNDTVFLGFGAEESDGSFEPWSPEDTRVDSDFTEEFDVLRLNLVSVSGPGQFAVWDGAQGWMDSSNGINAEDVLYILDGNHAHFDMGFTELGEYDVTFTVTASVGEDVQGNEILETSDPGTFTFIVPEPASAGLLGGMLLLLSRRRLKQSR